MAIFRLLGHKSKNQGHFLFFNFKSLRKQSILIFLIYGSGSEILAVFPVTMARPPPPEVQKTQWPYFGSWATNQKTKDTFFSSTFKVRENKVSLFFHFMAQGPRYWPLFRSRWYILLLHIVIFLIFKGSRGFFMQRAQLGYQMACNGPVNTPRVVAHFDF